MLFAVLSVVTAFVFAASVFWVAGEVLHRRKAVLAAQGEKLSVSNLVLWRLRNGYAFLVPPAQVILKWAKAADVHRFQCADGAAVARASSAILPFCLRWPLTPCFSTGTPNI